MSPEIKLLLGNLDEAYDQPAWHGPNLMDSLRDMTAAQADWRGQPNGHRIVEFVVHCAWWKYAARQYLLGAPLDTFPLAGKDWFELPEPLSEDAWNEYLQLLADQHQLLRAVISDFAPERLAEKSGESPVAYGQLMCGVAAHDVYHAGQIQMMKGMNK